MTQMSVLEVNPGGPKFEIVDAAARAAATGPLVAATAADMTDHNKIYVYTGSEDGYTTGDWYYWNGSAWISGGQYESSALGLSIIDGAINITYEEA